MLPLACQRSLHGLRHVCLVGLASVAIVTLVLVTRTAERVADAAAVEGGGWAGASVAFFGDGERAGPIALMPRDWSAALKDAPQLVVLFVCQVRAFPFIFLTHPSSARLSNGPAGVVTKDKWCVLVVPFAASSTCSACTHRCARRRAAG